MREQGILSWWLMRMNVKQHTNSKVSPVHCLLHTRATTQSPHTHILAGHAARAARPPTSTQTQCQPNGHLPNTVSENEVSSLDIGLLNLSQIPNTPCVNNA